MLKEKVCRGGKGRGVLKVLKDCQIFLFIRLNVCFFGWLVGWLLVFVGSTLLLPLISGLSTKGKTSLPPDQPLTFKSKVKSSGYTGAPRYYRQNNFLALEKLTLLSFNLCLFILLFKGQKCFLQKQTLPRRAQFLWESQALGYLVGRLVFIISLLLSPSIHPSPPSSFPPSFLSSILPSFLLFFPFSPSPLKM